VSQALEDLIEFIGAAAVGGLWPVVGRAQVKAWMRTHPAHVEEAKRRIREAVREGRL
jgi:hypothetical protein